MIRTLPSRILNPSVAAALLLVAAVLGWAPAATVAVQPAANADGSATPLTVGTGEIDLRVSRFGVGGRPRPGDWVGIQVELTNRSDRIREVIVRLAIPDAEGDTIWWERTIVPEPGARRAVWLYARLPFGSAAAVYNITAYEAIERPADQAGRAMFVAGRQVGATVAAMRPGPGGTMAAPVVPVQPAASMIGVVGQRAAGLERYPVITPGIEYSPTGHERIELVPGLRVSDLPDRWMGLAPLEALVWTASGTDGEPHDLTEMQAEAIREWVRRGGHLVVVLPPVGQTWMGRRDHLLSDIVPAAFARPLEGISLDPYRKLLTSRDDMPLPQNAVVNVLDPDPAASPYDVIRIIDGPDGQSVVVRRLVGTGAVTVIGLDLLSRSLAAMGGIDADILWNRVLGKRLILMSPEELDRSNILRLMQRTDRWLDRDIAGSIALQGQAASGLLLAFLVFLIYWLAAGPAGYFGLKRMGWKHHAWVAFIAVAGVFTAIAWGGANWLKPRKVEARHLTFLDHVYGQSNQRARIWMNLLLPEYGQQRVTIGDGTSADFRHALTSWDVPVAGLGLGSDFKMFPDSRGYSVDARSPDSATVPARSTIRQFQADWAGLATWKMPTPVIPAGATDALGREIRIIKRSDPPPGDRWWRLQGQLVHELPGALEDVVVVVVPRQGHLNVNPAGALVADVHAVTLSGPWEPGTVLDLGAVTAPMARAPTARQYFADLAGNPGELGMMQDEQSASTPGRDSVRRFTALAFYSMLEPPRAAVQVPETAVLARRQIAHTWDLGRWFTQPCIIIVGHLVDAESPVPIRVDGQPAPSTGRTVVRWIYPLEPEPPRFEPRLE